MGARRLLAVGALVTTAGLALAGTVSAAAGSWVVLGGWIALIFGLHRFGRTGAE